MTGREIVMLVTALVPLGLAVLDAMEARRQTVEVAATMASVVTRTAEGCPK